MHVCMRVCVRVCVSVFRVNNWRSLNFDRSLILRGQDKRGGQRWGQSDMAKVIRERNKSGRETNCVHGNEGGLRKIIQKELGSMVWKK